MNINLFKIILFFILLVFASNTLAQTSKNPAVSNVQIDTEFNPSALAPLSPSENNYQQRTPIRNITAKNVASPFNINLNQRAEEDITNQKPVAENENNNQAQQQEGVKFIDGSMPNANKQGQEFQPFNNYNFVKRQLTEGNSKNPVPKYILEQNGLTNKGEELKQRMKNPNAISSVQDFDGYQFTEKKQACDSAKTICIVYYVSEERIDVEVVNNKVHTVTISLLIYNTNSKINLLVKDANKIIVKGKETLKVAQILRLSPDEKFTFNFNFGSVDGHVEAIHNENYVYDLPFEIGKSFKMIQGYGGKFSHTDEENYFGYDFRMPTGTNIYAAREGVVVRIVENFERGGIENRLRQQANYIHIEHEDGTLGVYGHLMRYGATVKVGDYVQRGQKIGYSGNTGYSGSPHLHFAVVKVKKDRKLQSLPFLMRSSQGIFDKLIEGEYYTR